MQNKVQVMQCKFFIMDKALNRQRQAYALFLRHCLRQLFGRRIKVEPARGWPDGW